MEEIHAVFLPLLQGRRSTCLLDAHPSFFPPVKAEPIIRILFFKVFEFLSPSCIPPTVLGDALFDRREARFCGSPPAPIRKKIFARLCSAGSCLVLVWSSLSCTGGLQFVSKLEGVSVSVFFPRSPKPRSARSTEALFLPSRAMRNCVGEHYWLRRDLYPKPARFSFFFFFFFHGDSSSLYKALLAVVLRSRKSPGGPLVQDRWSLFFPFRAPVTVTIPLVAVVITA